MVSTTFKRCLAQRITGCRSCGNNELVSILNLGSTPPANSLLPYWDEELSAKSEEAYYPLELALCTSCSLAQITHSLPPAELFSDYPYFSSVSDALVAHARNIACRMVDECELGPHSQVIEIAGNDGYLLQHYRKCGVPVLNIEPAANIAEVAVKERGIPTRCEFFTEKLGAELRESGILADVVHANNVLAHVPDLNGFVAGMMHILKENGRAVLEVPYVKDMLDHCEFDTIYHEHLCYFSLTALQMVFERNGLQIRRVERIGIHGGSLRLFAWKSSSELPENSVTELLAEEAAWGVNETAPYLQFARKVDQLRTSLRILTMRLKAEGNRIAAYGASAKGSTLLNYIGLGRETLEYVVDKSPHKQGHFMPGVHLPILSPAKLSEDMPEYALLLTWNFAQEIMEQQSEYRRRGGKFIVPVPEVHIV